MSKSNGETLAKLEEFYSGLPNREYLRKVWKKVRDMNRNNGIGIIHSMMQLLVADYVADRGCDDLYAEYVLNDDSETGRLVIDVYGVSRTRNTVGVEVETLPSYTDINAPVMSATAKNILKVARYSPCVDCFSLAFLPTYRLPLPKFFINRGGGCQEGPQEIKDVLDTFYRNPPLTIEEISKGSVYSAYVVDIDKRKVNEVPVESKAIWKVLKPVAIPKDFKR